MTRRGEADDVADLGDEDRRRGSDRSRWRLDRLVALIVLESPGELFFDHRDLTIDELEQVAKRLHPDRVGAVERHLVDRSAGRPG